MHGVTSELWLRLRRDKDKDGGQTGSDRHGKPSRLLTEITDTDEGFVKCKEAEYDGHRSSPDSN